MLVIGVNSGRDPVEMLEALDVGRARLVVACPPPSPRAVPAADVAAAAESLGVEAVVAPTPAAAVQRALALAREEELILVTGSLYVVGAARTAYRRLHPG